MSKQKWFRLVEGQWTMVVGRDLIGKTLDEVANIRPGFLQWVYLEKFEDLDDQQYYALEDVMKAHKISLVKKRRPKQTHHRTLSA
jgi:hypothetical protein